MSQTIDSKVVELQFNNQNFEQNVKTSLSTLDRLKAALNFGGMVKGFDEITRASKNVNFSGMSTAVDIASSKFSALETAGVGALMHIGSQAVSTAEKLIKSVSIDQIYAGWNKFEEKTKSVGTLIAQGYNMDTVTEQLDKLNWYTDETSYNFTDMVENISKFTAAGQDLEASVTAMEGIANWAALSGQNATKASQAMYQLSQAMGKGALRLDDYKSIQNASMDTQEFRQHCLDAAVALGTLKKTGEDTYETLAESKKGPHTFDINTFTEYLTKDAWLTSDVMMKVFQEYSSAVDQIYEYAEEHGVTASEAIEALGDQLDGFGLKAFKAGQEARSFGDVIDSVKDAVSTSWMNVFETVFGNYEEQTVLWTAMANEAYEIFATPINNLQELLESAFGRTTGVEAIDRLKEGFDLLSKGTEKSTESLEEYHKLAKEVIRGTWGDDWNTRIQKMSEAGISDETIQTVRDYVNTIHKLAEGNWELTDSVLGEADARLQNAETIVQLSDAELEALGYTKEEIATLRELQKQSEETGKSINELLKEMEGKSGRDLFIGSFKNIYETLQTIGGQVKQVWGEIFDPITGNTLFNGLQAFNNFTQGMLSAVTERAPKIRQIFRGIFSVVDIAGSALLSLGKNLFPILGKGFGGIADTAINAGAAMGRFLVSIRGSIKQSKLFDKVFGSFSKSFSRGIDIIQKAGKIVGDIASKVFERIGARLPGITESIGSFIDKIQSSKFGQTVGDFANKAFEGIEKFFSKVDTDKVADTIVGFLDKAIAKITELYSKIKDAKPLEFLGRQFGKAKTAVEGFLNSFVASGKNGEIDFKSTFLNIGNSIKNAFKEAFLGVNVYGDEIGGDLVKGGGASSIFERIKDNLLKPFNDLKEKITTGLSEATTLRDKIVAVLSPILSPIKDFLSKFTLEDVTGLAKEGSIIYTILQVAKVLEKNQGLIESLTHVTDHVGTILKNVSELPLAAIETLKEVNKTLQAYQSQLKAGTLLKTAAAIGIIFGALALAVYAFGKLDNDQLLKGLAAMAVIGAILALILSVVNMIPSGNPIENGLSTLATSIAKSVKKFAKLAGVGILMAGVGVAVAMIANTIKTLISIPWDQAMPAITALVGIAGGLLMFCGIMAKMNSSGQLSIGAAATVLAIAIAIKMLVGPIKKLGKLPVGQLIQGLLGVAVLLGGLAIAMKTMNSVKISLSSVLVLTALAVALNMLVLAVKLLGKFNLWELIKGLGGVFILLDSISIAMATIGNGASLKTVGTISALTAAVAVLVLLAKSMANMSFGELVKGIGGIAAILFSLAGALKLVGNSLSGNDVFSILAIGVMTMAIITIANVVNELAKLPIEKALTATLGLSALLMSMAGSFKIFSTIPLVGIAKGALGLIIAVAAIVGVIEALGAIINNDKFGPGFVKNLNAFAETFGTAIGKFIGSMQGAQLEASADGLKAFAEKVNGIDFDNENITKARELMTFFQTIAGDEKIEYSNSGLLGMIVNHNDTLANFAAGIGTMGEAISAFGNDVSDAKFIQTKIEAAQNCITFLQAVMEDKKIKSSSTGLWGWIKDNDTTLVELGKGAEKLGTAIASFGNNVSDAKFIQSKIDAAESAITFLQTVMKDRKIQSSATGLGGWLKDNNTTLVEFGRGAERLGTAIASFGNNVSDAKFVQSKIEAAQNCITFLQTVMGDSGIQSSMTGIGAGGLFMFVAHNNTTLDSFATGAQSLGKAIASFGDHISGASFDPVNISKAKYVIDFLKTLAGDESIQSFKSGFLGLIVDENTTLDKFGEGAEKIGNGIKRFMDSVNKAKVDEAKVSMAMSVLQSLAEIERVLNEAKATAEDGLYDGGELFAFAADLVAVGDKLKVFANDVSKLSLGKALATVLALPVIKAALEDFVSADLSGASELESNLTILGKLDIPSLLENLTTQGDQIKEAAAGIVSAFKEGLSSDTTDTDSITGAASELVSGLVSAIDTESSEAKSAGESLCAAIVDGMNASGDQIPQAMNGVMEDTLLQVTGKEGEFRSGGSSNAVGVYIGLMSYNGVITSVFNGPLSSAANQVRGFYGSFFSAAAQAASGIAAGLRSQLSEINSLVSQIVSALARARSAQSAASAAASSGGGGASSGGRGLLKSSYSEVAEEVLDAAAPIFYETGQELSAAAKQGMSDSLKKVSDVLNSGLDSNPVITPVMDLSHVQDGLVTLNSMFGTDSNLGYTSNVGAVASMMYGRNQNNGNTDVIDAIDRLGRSLNRRGDTYNINGITYDDGSNITGAVRDLVRAVRLERRGYG